MVILRQYCQPFQSLTVVIKSYILDVPEFRLTSYIPVTTDKDLS